MRGRQSLRGFRTICEYPEQKVNPIHRIDWSALTLKILNCIPERNLGAAAMIALLSLVPALLAQSRVVPSGVKGAENEIDPLRIAAHVRFLSDDLMEGRYPGLRGGELAAKYVATQFALDG